MKKGFFALCLLGVLVSLGACANSSFVDYASELKLVDSPVGKTFLKDGIGVATLESNVDGDTAYFVTDGASVKVRFLGIDTPESTGQVEPWGKAASKFTASKLDAAVAIILESNGGAAKKDTTDTRYLGYVWYKTAEMQEYRNLNLEVMQEGYSKGKGSASAKYDDITTKAQTQAMKQKKNVWSKDEDPNYFYGDGQELTIKEILTSPESYVDTKVKFDALITRVDGMYIYCQETDLETGKTYAIMLYEGYNLITRKLVIGNMVTICGVLSLFNGVYQVQAMQDIPGSTSLDNLQVISKDNPVIPKEIVPSDLDINNKEIFRTLVSMKDFVVGDIQTAVSGAMTIQGKVNGQSVQVRTGILRLENRDLVTSSMLEGKTIDIVGIVDKYNNLYQFKIVKYSDITFR